ncbi:MAG: hypothetical protein HRT36_00580 [Alphaproteobacteria bacterium]|nr:hypothetical protein [Alphaproteobacteria bacterium]
MYRRVLLSAAMLMVPHKPSHSETEIRDILWFPAHAVLLQLFPEQDRVAVILEGITECVRCTRSRLQNENALCGAGT